MGITLLSLLISGQVRADDQPADLGRRLDALEGRQRLLERRLELQQEDAAAKAKETPIAAAGEKSGFSLRTPDDRFLLKAGAYFQLDSRSYPNNRAAGTSDQFLLRVVRIILEGTVQKNVDFYFMPDFGAGKAALQDAYADIRYSPEAKLRLGRFKPFFGLERIQPDRNLEFMERSLPTGLVPNRDIGAQLHGDVFEGTLNYSVGVYNGVPDGGSSDGDADSNKDFVGRLFFSPLKNTDWEPSNDLGLGIAANHGAQWGSAAASGLSGYVTNDQQAFFSYAANVQAAGKRYRYSPQGYWYHGRFGVLGEYVLSEQDVKKPASKDTTASLKNSAWQAVGSWVLTGESAAYRGVKPARPFDLSAGTIGAVELVGRYSEQWMDARSFPTYADPAQSARGVRSWTAGLNWYPNLNARVMIDYEHSEFSGGKRNSGQAVMTRFQVGF